MNSAHGDKQGDLFATEHWFAHLLENGFGATPIHHVVPLGRSGNSLHLMQTSKRAALASLSNYYSGLYAPVGHADGLSAEQWLEVATAVRSLPGSAEIRLQPLAADADWRVCLERALRGTGYRTDSYFCFGNWYQPVPVGGYASYWSQRPSKLRHSVERARRRLDKAGTWRIDIHLGDSADLEPAISAYQMVYNSSWKPPEPRPEFVPVLIRLAAEQGWLRLGVLSVAGEPVAAQLWLVAGGKANIFKLAYVQGHEKLSAGSVLTAALMQQVMNVDQVVEVDYLSGDDAYKADWMACRRERVGLVAFDLLRPRGVLAAARHYGGRLRARMQR